MAVAIADIIAAKLLVQLGWRAAPQSRADLAALDARPGSPDLVTTYVQNGILPAQRGEKLRRYVWLYARCRRDALYAALVEQSGAIDPREIKRMKAQLEIERPPRTFGELLLAERRVTPEQHARIMGQVSVQLSHEDEKLLERYRRARFDGVDRAVTRDPHARIETGVFTIRNLFRSPESQRMQKVEAEDAAARPRPPQQAAPLDAVARQRQAELAQTSDESTPPHGHSRKQPQPPQDDATPLEAPGVHDAEAVRTIQQVPPTRQPESVLTGRRTTPAPPPGPPGIPRRLGDYEVQRVLGKGGMGIVLLARHPEQTEPVAIKLSHSKDEEHVARIKREILATSMVSHENIVSVVDAGETEDGSPYLVMELVRGRELRELLKEKGALPPKDALAVFVQVLGAAGAAHRAGIVHRDLKPENVLVTEKDGNLVAKLMDFGLARIVELDPAHVEKVFQTVATNVVSGSPQYLSPEQVMGEAVDARTDLYSLGIVLFELLTGSLPYQGKALSDFIRAHITGKPKLLSQVKPGLPRSLEVLISSLLEKMPERRPASAEAVIRTIEDQVLPDLAPMLAKTVDEEPQDGRVPDEPPPSFADMPLPSDEEKKRGITKILKRLQKNPLDDGAPPRK